MLAGITYFESPKHWDIKHNPSTYEVPLHSELGDINATKSLPTMRS